MGIAAGAELRHFLSAMRSWRMAFTYVARRVLVHLKDLLVHRRGMQLVNGNALVARPRESAFDRGVELRASPGRATDPRAIGSRGAVVKHRAARRGSLRDAASCSPAAVSRTTWRRRRELFPHTPTGDEHWSAAPPGNTGDGLRLGESAGGVVDAKMAAGAVGARVPRAAA